MATIKAINKAGREFDYDFDAAVNLMNDDLREQVHGELAPCSDQTFFDRYCELHRRKFGEDFGEVCWRS